jgi:hypothetical protein
MLSKLFPPPEPTLPSGEKPEVQDEKHPAAAMGESLYEMGKWFVETPFKMALDPAGAAQEDLFDVTLFLSPVAKEISPLKRTAKPKQVVPEGRTYSQKVLTDYVNERVRKRGGALAPEEMASVVERGDAVRAAHANPSTLVSDAKSRGVPGADSGVFKVKDRGTMPVTVNEVLELTDPRIPDLPMNFLERATTNMVHTVKSHPLFKKLYWAYQYVDRAHLQEFARIRKEVTGGWKKRISAEGLKWRASSERIANHLTGLQKGGPEVLESMGKRIIRETDLKPIELQIVKEARHVYDAFFQRINAARKLAGKDPIKYIENYYSWMRNLDTMREMGFSFAESTASEINGALSATPFKFAHTRKGVFPSPISLDFFNVFELYAKDSLKHIHYSPVIAKGRALLENMNLPATATAKSGKPYRISYKLKHDRPVLAQSMETWINQIAGKGDLSKIPDHAKVQKSLAKLNRNIAVSTLGLNARSAFIQWTALRGAFTEAGYLHTAKGLMQNLSKAKRDFAMRNSVNLFGRNMDIHVADVFNKATKGKIKNINKALQEGSLNPLQLIDMETARSAWLSHYDYYTTRLRKSQRLPHPEAVKAADEAVLRHQASGKIGDVAPMQRGIAGRLLTTFQTFTTAEWNWMMRDVLGIKNPEVNLGQSLVRTTRFLITTATINAIFEDLLGVPSPFPAPERAIRGGVEEGKAPLEIAGDVGLELMEAVPVIGAPVKFSQKWRTSVPTASGQLATDLVKLGHKMVSQKWEDITIYDLEAFAKLAGLPGAAQARKTISRMKKGEPIWCAIMGGTGNKPSGGFGMMK